MCSAFNGSQGSELFELSDDDSSIREDSDIPQAEINTVDVIHLVQSNNRFVDVKTGVYSPRIFQGYKSEVNYQRSDTADVFNEHKSTHEFRIDKLLVKDMVKEELKSDVSKSNALQIYEYPDENSDTSDGGEIIRDETGINIKGAHGFTVTESSNGFTHRENKFEGRDDMYREGFTPQKLLVNSQAPSLTYGLENFTKNAMIIFNHEHFLSDTRRRGTDLDVAAIKVTFERFRFDVSDEAVHHDLTREELFKELEKCKILKSMGALPWFILTHGQDHGYLKAFDTRYSERDVIECFDARANPTLVGKPIVFLMQACRGRFPAYVVEAQDEIAKPILTVELDAELAIERICRPNDSDIIMFHSSFFGRASIRVVEEGTWFIQTVCEQIRLHAATDHLEELFWRVRRSVAEMEHEGKKQMPVVTSTLLRKLYLKEGRFESHC